MLLVVQEVALTVTGQLFVVQSISVVSHLVITGAILPWLHTRLNSQVTGTVTVQETLHTVVPLVLHSLQWVQNNNLNSAGSVAVAGPYRMRQVVKVQ